MSQSTTFQLQRQDPRRPPLHIFVLADNHSTGPHLQNVIMRLGFSPSVTSDPKQILKQLSNVGSSVVLCDRELPALDDILFLGQALAVNSGVCVIFITNNYSAEAALSAIRKGAYGYLPKPSAAATVKRTLEDLEKVFQRRRFICELQQTILNDAEFHGIVGRSAVMIELFELAQKIAWHYTDVLITGATGTGKELLAHAIHKMSPVNDKRCAFRNCASLSDAIPQRQFFGQIRPAIAGTGDAWFALFKDANGGTVILDEIAELSLEMQARLVRLMQSSEIQKTGTLEVRHVDVRLIVTSSHDLESEVATGRFRRDLFERLKDNRIYVPSLLERVEDVPLLATFFLKKYNDIYHKNIRGFTSRAQSVLMLHTWPGNVREFENVISGAALIASDGLIGWEHLPEHVQKTFRPARPAAEWQPLPLDDIRQEHILRVLDVCRGNRVRTAQMLGIGRTSLYRYLKRDVETGKTPRVHAI